jgi:hypothetical protein
MKTIVVYYSYTGTTRNSRRMWLPDWARTNSN